MKIKADDTEKRTENNSFSGIERRKKALMRAYEQIRDKYVEEVLFTYAEFDDAYREWYRKEETSLRRHTDHEIYRETDTIYYADESAGKVFPEWMGLMEQKQVQRGNFIETIYNCPYEIHELVSDAYISEILKKLKPEHKEIIFYEIIRGYSTKEVANIMGQSERNIRKKCHRILKQIQKETYNALHDKPKQNVREKAFLERYEGKLNEN